MIKDSKRAKRRGHMKRLKSKAKRIMSTWSGGRNGLRDPRCIGVNVSTHCCPCACWDCQSPRKEVPPMRERGFDDRAREMT